MSATLARTDDVEAQARQYLGGRVRDFRICRRAEGFVLHGRATTYYAKQLAQQAVMSITETRIVSNEIEVLDCRGI
jgi:hypothetical protein